MKKFLVFFLVLTGLAIATQLEIFSSSGEWAYLENPARVFFLTKQGIMGAYHVLSSESGSLGTFQIGLFQPPSSNIAGVLFLKRTTLENAQYVTTAEYDIALSPQESITIGVGTSFSMDQDSKKELNLHAGVFGYLTENVEYSVGVRNFTLWSEKGSYMGGIYSLKLLYDTPRKNRFSYTLKFDQRVLENKIDFSIGNIQKAGFGISMLTNTDSGENALKISLGFYATVNNVSIGFNTFIASSSVSSDSLSEYYYTKGVGLRFAVRW
ncbi:hypothetical protein [Thermotoga sp. KOL6]|uniref:hypothetical protein n=1 Tax=Thermotoga sp. KOL6 TaxID=126741 RepID=UPI000C7823A4|nr:hypothetical protein [Thermotoga sp. KOL6]PLV60362.1 hypothetical protein AS005_03530 [Thermotoga sp. KOL6]